MIAKSSVAALGLLATLLVAKPSSAWVHVCNKTTHPIWIVYADLAYCSGFANLVCGKNMCGNDIGAHLHESGWYAAQPGACVTPNGGDADDFNSYVYAEDSFGHVWQDWNGPLVSAPQTAFSRCSNTEWGDLGCDHVTTRCLFLTKWFPSTNNWTLNINP